MLTASRARVLKPHQERILRECREAIAQGKRELCVVSVTGCHAADTRVWMADKNLMPVERVQVGDVLMGWDGQHEEVVQTIHGIGDMYLVEPDEGMSFVCNGDHVLSLWVESSRYGGTVFEETVKKQYLRRAYNTSLPAGALFAVRGRRYFHKSFEFNGRRRIKPARLSGFKIKPLGTGHYYGFTLSGSGRYLLEDFTVTHNSGKSLVMFEQLQQALRSGHRVAVYCNRRLLFDQLASGMYDLGITHGLRAAGYRPFLTRDIQLCMAQTERSRVLDTDSRELHDADLVIVDEAHLNAQGGMLRILRNHLASGAALIGYTATPSDVGHLYTTLIEGATASEGRACGLLLPARCYGIEEPDKKWVKRNKVGEEKIGDKVKKLYVHQIYGRVIEHWRRLNPERLPTILFAPGVEESRWFATAMWSMAINAAHIDAKGVLLEGKWHSGDKMRHEVLDRFRSGEIEILCNRFVLREGISVEEIYHGILATKFGSETTYLQAVGRILRNHESLPAHVLMQDHGGNALRYGSPNLDRTWVLSQSSEEREYLARRQREDNPDADPFVCPNCFGMRRSGDTCPYCGFTYRKRTRRVLQVGGDLVNYGGDYFRKPVKAPPDLQKLWESCYHGARRSGTRTFRQAFAWFAKQAYQKTRRLMRPDPEWAFMPKRIIDEIRRVADVPAHKLKQKD